MFTLIIIGLDIVNMFLLFKLLKSGTFVRVEEKHVYVPAKKKKTRAVPLDYEEEEE